jgi:hypothetical protein
MRLANRSRFSAMGPYRLALLSEGLHALLLVLTGETGVHRRRSGCTPSARVVSKARLTASLLSFTAIAG